MAGSRVIAPYNSDIMAQLFETSVPTPYFAETGRGWSINTFLPGKTPRLPSLLTPRHVVGVTGAGLRRRAIVADLTADLWTGAATTFIAIGTDGTNETCTVTGFVGEKVTTRTNA